MSRVVFIMVILLLIVFSGIVVSLTKGESGISESVASNVYSKNAENLGSYALQWGIKQIIDGTMTEDTKQNFTNFTVLNGKIKSVDYDFRWNDQPGLVKIVANVEWTEGGKTYTHQSSAIINFIKPSNLIPNAVVTGTELKVQPGATINGDKATYTEINFEEIFFMSKEEMKARATHYYNNPGTNPSPVNGITWIDGNVHFSSSATGMSGLLIINGHCNWSGADFDGILYVIGELQTDIEGNSDINGAILLEGSGFIRGHTVISYDAKIVDGVYNNYISPIYSDSLNTLAHGVLVWAK